MRERITAGDVYQGGELFNFFVDRADLEDESLDSVPVEISWTRVGQYLPWMQMGAAPGRLIYHVRGWKLPDGVSGLPQHITDYVNTQGRTEYFEAPDAPPAGFTPNATTWREFASMVTSGEYAPACF